MLVYQYNLLSEKKDMGIQLDDVDRTYDDYVRKRNYQDIKQALHLKK